MELITVQIPRKVGDHSPIYICPIGDIQWAGRNGPTAKEHLKEHIARCQKLGGYYILMGDAIDFLSPSNRQRLQASNLYDSATDVIDATAIDLVHELYQDFLKPTRGRFLCVLSGHHYHQLKSGDTSDMRLAALLNTTFVGTSAFIRLQFVEPGHRVIGNVVLFAHHGVGGGMTAGAPLNRLEKLAMGWEGADVFLIGHTTRMPAARIQRPYPRWDGAGAPDLVHRDIHLVNTGGFMKGHIVGAKQGIVPAGGYAEQNMYNPSSIGAPIIKIVPRIRYYDRQSRPKHGKRIGEMTRTKMWSPDITVEL